MIVESISASCFGAKFGEEFQKALENTYDRLPYSDDSTQIFFEYQMKRLKDICRKKTIEIKNNGDIVIISKKSENIVEKAIKDNNKFYLSYKILDKILNSL